jgi:hypothetical protein
MFAQDRRENRRRIYQRVLRPAHAGGIRMWSILSNYSQLCKSMIAYHAINGIQVFRVMFQSNNSDVRFLNIRHCVANHTVCRGQPISLPVSRTFP